MVKKEGVVGNKKDSMNYTEKLKDPRWQKKRLEILQRDEFTCVLCGDKESTLHVHHHTYSGQPWHIESSKLKTVCSDCHFLLHKSPDLPDHPFSVMKVKKDDIILYVLKCEETVCLLTYDFEEDLWNGMLLSTGIFKTINHFLNG
jgi:hypothetical protein